MAESLPRHPFGLRYILLKLGALLIRLPSLIGLTIKTRKDFRTLDPALTRTRIQIPSREKKRTITVDVYEKKRGSGNQRQDVKPRVHVNFHGSGFVIPSLGTDFAFCSQLASKSGVDTVVFDADYRKAPEHPFPAAYDDAQDVLRYVLSRPDDFDIDVQSNHGVTLGGFSAGANLAMAVAVTSLPHETPISGITAFYGNTDMTTAYLAPSKEHDSGVVLPPWLRRFFYNSLILPGQERSDPRLSPAFAPLDRWPAHVFFACGMADGLHDAAKVMARRLVDEGGHGDVAFMSVEGEAHSFDKGVNVKGKTGEKMSEMYRRAIEMIERAQRDA